MNNFNSQSGQDQFVLKVLNNKQNGYFLEIGSQHPIKINNSFILENKYNWNGLMVEYENMYEELYKKYRTSHYIIKDATKIDYNNLFLQYNFPTNMDYLQIDLDVHNKSTINVLELLNNTIFKNYKFSVVTFEHDIYRGNYFDTRSRSRTIFEENGYIIVYGNVKNEGLAFEDWYVHPSLVDMDFINKIKSSDSLEWQQIINNINNN